MLADDLKAMLARAPRIDREVFVCDPETYEEMKSQFREAPDSDMVPVHFPLLGVKVCVRSIGKYFRPPRDRFIQYEDSDLPWLEKLGIGKYCEIRYTVTLKESSFRKLLEG